MGGLPADVGQEGHHLALDHLGRVGGGKVVGNHHRWFLYVRDTCVFLPGKVHNNSIHYVFNIGTSLLKIPVINLVKKLSYTLKNRFERPLRVHPLLFYELYRIVYEHLVLKYHKMRINNADMLFA